MLATTWNVFGVGAAYEYPDDFQHYFVYWVGPWMAAIAASFLYVIYGMLVAGRDIFIIACPRLLCISNISHSLSLSLS
jgi:hypothetical protein